MPIKHTNFASSKLAVGLGAGDVTLAVTGTHGSRFPVLGASDFCYLVLENALKQREIVKATARSGDTFTVVRGQDDTTAQVWVAGDTVSLRFVKAAIADSIGNAVQRTSATGSAILPVGTTAQRDGTPAVGYTRANTTTGQMEWWNGTAWQSVGADSLNTARADVASATTVDLTAGAPSTRNINITGTTTITGFTVAIGQVYFVRFNAALTLTNNAAIITQRGANITTSAGDTCILRSTSANIVEVLSYSYAGIVPDASITTAKVADAGITAPKLSGAQTGTAPIYGARAWCVFNGTTAGTNAPTAGGNVATVTRNSAGNYTVNFSTAMPDANYSFVVMCGNTAGGVAQAATVSSVPTTSSVTFVTLTTTNGASVDPNLVSFTLFR